MREHPTAEVEQYRIMGERNGRLGQFKVTLCPLSDRPLGIIATDGTVEDGDREVFRQLTLPESAIEELSMWEHVSVSGQRFAPTWKEMCWVKDQFWLPEEVVMQLHVPPADHINVHNYCLHLWRLKPGVMPVGHGHVTSKFDYDEPLPALRFLELPRPPHLGVAPKPEDYRDPRKAPRFPVH